MFSSLSLASFMAHKALAFLFITRRLALHGLVQVLIVVIHGIPLWSFFSW